MFYFGVYFRKFMGKIVYTSTLPDCPNSHVQHLFRLINFSRKNYFLKPIAHYLLLSVYLSQILLKNQFRQSRTAIHIKEFYYLFRIIVRYIEFCEFGCHWMDKIESRFCPFREKKNSMLKFGVNQICAIPSIHRILCGMRNCVPCTWRRP